MLDDMNGLLHSDDDRSQRNRMLAGDLYRADDPELVDARLRASRLIDRLNAALAEETRELRRILGELLGSFGADSEIRPPLFCEYGSTLHVGTRTFINFGLMALDVACLLYTSPSPRDRTRSR